MCPLFRGSTVLQGTVDLIMCPLFNVLFTSISGFCNYESRCESEGMSSYMTAIDSCKYSIQHDSM